MQFIKYSVFFIGGILSKGEINVCNIVDLSTVNKRVNIERLTSCHNLPNIIHFQ